MSTVQATKITPDHPFVVELLKRGIDPAKHGEIPQYADHAEWLEKAGYAAWLRDRVFSVPYGDWSSAYV